MELINDTGYFWGPSRRENCTHWKMKKRNEINSLILSGRFIHSRKNDTDSLECVAWLRSYSQILKLILTDSRTVRGEALTFTRAAHVAARYTQYVL